ncbi:hypothetical protein BDR06DRAFT_874064, partial [Suillus hirtellus]
HCENVQEMVQHYLLLCPHYAQERHILTNTPKRQASSITFLLSNAKATDALI